MMQYSFQTSFIKIKYKRIGMIESFSDASSVPRQLCLVMMVVGGILWSLKVNTI